MRGRILMIGAAAAIVVAAACGDSNGPGGASSVAMNSNTVFVDYDTSLYGSEASEMQHTYESFGVQVHTFTAYDSATFDSIIGLAPILVFSEARAAMPESLSTGTLALIRHWVDSLGGVLVVNPEGDNIQLLDSLFNYALVLGSAQTVNPLDAAAAGTPFAGGPAQVFDNNGTFAIQQGSLPAGALPIYGNGTNIVVALIPQGRGAVVLLGWDWFNAAPHGSQDGGWVEVLRRSLGV